MDYPLFGGFYRKNDVPFFIKLKLKIISNTVVSQKTEQIMKKNPFKKYSDKFSEFNFWEKIKNYAIQAGQKTVYTALLLYYAFKRSDTPAWAKRVVLGALGYFLSPIDGIPDLTPFLGYTDDLGVLSFGLVLIAGYINDEVRENAREQMTKWFGDINEEELNEVDDSL